jgi:cell cycle checkpoint protein
MEQCDGVAEWLSWVDSSGGEAVSFLSTIHFCLLNDTFQWYQANPHRFHLLTLGTLHSLPSPVVRRSQKVFKPEFFDMLNREKDGWGGVGDVRKWLIDEIGMAAEMDKVDSALVVICV